jgi:hypothetical protein
LLQLKPVFDDWIFNDLDKGITALAPNLWKDLFSMHELTEIMRQKDDLDFAQLSILTPPKDWLFPLIFFNLVSKKENIFFPTIEISSIMTMDKFLYFI